MQTAEYFNTFARLINNKNEESIFISTVASPNFGHGKWCGTRLYRWTYASAKEVIIRKTDKTKKKDRDSFPDVSAVYSQSMNLVSVELFEVGPATVYVVDSRGQVVSSESTEGFEYESVSLRVPSRGDVYTLVIWGTYLYGEGTFTVE